MDLTTCPAALADLETLVPLFEDYRAFYEQSADPALARQFLGARLALGDSVIYVAETAGRALGFVQLYPIIPAVTSRSLVELHGRNGLPDDRPPAPLPLTCFVRFAC